MIKIVKNIKTLQKVKNSRIREIMQVKYDVFQTTDLNKLKYILKMEEESLPKKSFSKESIMETEEVQIKNDLKKLY